MNTDAPTLEMACYHCGEACHEEAVQYRQKAFCCSGCRMVYEILDDHEMTTYYRLDEQPGTSRRHEKRSRFDYLDDATIAERLADFQDEELVSLGLYIPAIHCTSCVWLLENLYKLDRGISRCSVNFLKRELSVAYRRSATSLRAVVELLASIGYEPELRLEKLDQTETAGPDRQLWLKLGVAGFAFGNIMLFSFPEYLSGSTLQADGIFNTVFGVLNIAIALPVLFYSSSDYMKSAWAAVQQGGINLDVPICIGILALFCRSVYEIGSATGPGYMDSLTGLVFFLLIGRIVQKKTYEQLSFDRDYKSYLPISVTVQEHGGVEKTVSLEQLSEGAILLIRNRELVPADSILTSDRCFIDYSFITGESDPVEVQRGDTIYAGGKVMGRAAHMRTVKEVSNSYLTRLWNDAAFDGKPSARPRLSTLADRISPHFTLAVLTVAGVAGILWFPVDAAMAVSVFTAVLIIACPCALALSTPFALGSSLNIFARNGLYIKGIEVVEQLARSTALVFDKTGTLTNTEQAAVSFQGVPLSDIEKAMVRTACSQSVHPLSRNITAFLGNTTDLAIRDFEETINKGIRATVDGTGLVVGSAGHLSETLGIPLPARPSRQGDESASVVGLAIDGLFRGWFRISSAYRPGIACLLQQFKGRFQTYLLSGDNASQKPQFEPHFRETALLFNQSPQQKLDFIQDLQKRNEHVVMVGDGLNDAGALQKSDFGIALTDDISSFTPACDAIIDGAALQRLDTFIDFARTSIATIKLSFGLSLIYNIVGLGFAVTGQLTPLTAAVLMPLSSISIMLFTTGSSYLNAKRMGLITWK